MVVTANVLNVLNSTKVYTYNDESDKLCYTFYHTHKKNKWHLRGSLSNNNLYQTDNISDILQHSCEWINVRYRKGETLGCMDLVTRLGKDKLDEIS